MPLATEYQIKPLPRCINILAVKAYGEAEFWSIFNKPDYYAVKAITDPRNVFRDLYTKTCRAAMGHN